MAHGAFWRSRDVAVAWGLIGLLVICVVLQVFVQYRLNLWNRAFFNALEFCDGREIWHQTYLLMILAAPSIGLAVFAVWCRMNFTAAVASMAYRNAVRRLGDERYRRLDLWNDEPQNAEYRIAEDARLATNAPIDLVVGLLGSLLSAATFVVVLWHVGGSLNVELGGLAFSIPGYLVVGAVAYATLTTGTMMLVGRHMVDVMECKDQAESELKYALRAIARERGGAKDAVGRGGHDNDRVDRPAGGHPPVATIVRTAHAGTTIVSHGNTLLAPLVGLILCVPYYVQGAMLLGEVTQAAAAFVAVQGAFNWLVDNYPCLAEWLSSANRVGTLLGAFDRLEATEGPR